MDTDMTAHTTSTQHDTLPPWVTISQTALYLSISERTTRRLIASGDLKAKRIGKRLLRIDRASVLALAG